MATTTSTKTYRANISNPFGRGYEAALWAPGASRPGVNDLHGARTEAEAVAELNRMAAVYGWTLSEVWIANPGAWRQVR